MHPSPNVVTTALSNETLVQKAALRIQILKWGSKCVGHRVEGCVCTCWESGPLTCVELAREKKLSVQLDAESSGQDPKILRLVGH